jgi:hypothetical protein
MLRKELSKVEHEGENRKEFMNQPQVWQGRITTSSRSLKTSSVRAKIKMLPDASLKSINEEKDQESFTANDEVKLLRFKVEEERKAHEKERETHAKERDRSKKDMQKKSI